MNDEKSKHKKEYDFLKGDDSYSMSKVGVENYVKYYVKNNKKFKIITIRAGNVLGGGDWSEKDSYLILQDQLLIKKNLN